MTVLTDGQQRAELSGGRSADAITGMVGRAVADAVAAVETIEHLENPRRFVRLPVRLLRPGGWLFVTTPNQRSLLSLASLVVKGEFAHFQGVHYPAALASAFPRALSDNLMLVARRR